MKIKSILNKAKKLGYKTNGETIHPTNSKKKMSLMHSANNPNDISAIFIQRTGDINDPIAGSYYYTIKGAFDAVCREMNATKTYDIGIKQLDLEF